LCNDFVFLFAGDKYWPKVVFDETAIELLK